ncbi:MAG TPA: hydantoinase/carbamoylase family amidase [Hanamia sp.]|nr:hydantoinase/carbamoylase family amidase [Hanamia sp.]
MDNFLERALHIQQRINQLSTQNPKTELYGSKSFIEKSNTIVSWMKGAGLETRIDNIGNIRGKLKSKNSDAKTFVIGSHFDNGIGAEKYDGILGVLSGINIVEHLQSKQLELPFNIEVIAFAEEEGLRFNFTSLGSKVVAGTFKNKLLDLKDDNGVSLSEVLKSMHLNPEKLKEDAIPADDFLGYFEIHVEQGSVLANSNIPVGIAGSIFGQKRIEIEFSGKDGHAGNVTMDKRNDALAAAAKFIISVEKYAKRSKGNIVATVGKIHIPGAASNKIAGSVTCTLDLRSNNEKSLSEAYEIINNECEKICGKRNIYFEWKLIQETDPVICNKKLKRLLANSISEKNIQFLPLESGAVYDAAIISKVAPVVMLFLISLKDSIGNSREDQEKNNIATALEISDHFIKQLLSSSDKSFRKKEKEK